MRLTTIQIKVFLRLVAAIVMSTAIISCSAVKEFSTGGESERARKLNERVPAGMKNAEQDYEVNQPSVLKIIMPAPGQILLQDPESQPIDLASLGSKAQEILSTKTPDKRVAYIAAAVDVPSREVAVVLDELQQNDIDVVRLITSGREPDADNGGVFSVPVIAPDRIFEVRIQNDVSTELRPNPLTLFVTTGADGRPTLNNEPQSNLEVLTSRLSEVFTERERNGVLRANSNEVEKTVMVKLSKDETDRRYGDFVKLVNAIKGSGATPIVLSEGLTLQAVTSIPDDVVIPKPNVREVPKSISGGVLNGKAVELPKPLYPPAAKAVNAKGAVNVQITVDIDGKVIKADAVSGHPLLRQAAVSASRSAKFNPTLLSGRPVKVNGILIYNFVP